MIKLEDKIAQLRGSHVIVYFGDGTDKPSERLFGTATQHESNALCDLVLELLAARAKQREVRNTSNPGSP